MDILMGFIRCQPEVDSHKSMIVYKYLILFVLYKENYGRWKDHNCAIYISGERMT